MRKRIYVLLVSFLACEVAVVFFDWSLTGGIFWFMFSVVTLFSKKLSLILFYISIILGILALIFFAFSQSKASSVLSLWLFLDLILITWTLIMRAFEKKRYHTLWTYERCK